MAITTTDTALLRLLQLASPALPVGGYAFSQGLETALELGWVKDAASTRDWLRQQILHSLARVDVPLLLRLHRAALGGDADSFDYFNSYALACRETAELRLTDSAMGEALCRLLPEVGLPLPALGGDSSFTAVFAWAAAHWGIDENTAASGFLWAWLENQVAAATKLVPLGQSAAQRLLGELMPALNEALACGAALEDAGIGSSLPALALASAWHETQYTRLFRS
ncbi:urease accessory protein UreF [Haliea sp. E17]|uniref:urease accessory protein UreF n=1 Tax=Haliea sp. E17 TaxID=3401576 RepID=UPI003AAD3014